MSSEARVACSCAPLSKFPSRRRSWRFTRRSSRRRTARLIRRCAPTVLRVLRTLGLSDRAGSPLVDDLAAVRCGSRTPRPRVTARVGWCATQGRL
eukprot:6199585-Pleurochrysis_carterae.AAC.5